MLVSVVACWLWDGRAQQLDAREPVSSLAIKLDAVDGPVEL